MVFSCDLLLPNWSCGFGTIHTDTSDWNKRKRMTRLMSEVREPRLRMQRVTPQTGQQWAIRLDVLRQIFNVGKSFTILVFHVSSALPLSLILVMYTELPFPCLKAVSNCSTALSRSSRALCNVDFVAFAAPIQSAFFEGAWSSSREPRGVEEREVFYFVFLLIGIACASALMASLAS